MAAPSGITWGSIAGGYGRIGIYVKLTNDATTTKRHTEIWFWSKYSVSDTSNTFYYNDNATSATTSKGSVSISTPVSSGSGWSTSNQVKLAEYDYTFSRGTSSSTRNVAAKLTGIYRVGATMTATKSYTIPALASYTVSYNANGGSGAPSAQKKYYGTTLTLSSVKPTRSGYTFVGWGTSSSTTSTITSYSTNAAITLYAIWKKTITLTYNVNGGSGSFDKLSGTIYNATTSYKFTLSSSKPTRTGYDFLGWSTSSSATSASYAAGGTCTLSSSSTLYAVWKAKTYKITYNANGGSNPPSEQSYTYASSGTITLSSVKPTRTGYTFVNWNTKTDGTGTTYSSGSTFNRYNSSTTLYAQWSINKYTVSYNPNGGSGAPSNQTKTYGVNLTLSSVKPTRTNYTFLGWATSASATTSTYTSGGTYSANKSVTLYAVWKIAYKKPSITNFSVERCDSTGSVTDDGTNALIEFNWSTTLYDVKDIIVTFISGSDRISRTIYASGQYGEVSNHHIKDIELSPDITYSVILTVSDTEDSSYKTATIPGIKFIMDLLAGGNGISFGKAADMDGYADFLFKTRHRDDIYIDNNKYIYGRDTAGTPMVALIPKTESGNTALGYDNYHNSGNTNIYGTDVYFYVKNASDYNNKNYYMPYLRKGNSLEKIVLRTSGYVTNSGTEVSFCLPLTVPIIGKPNVTATSVDGFILRQGASYTHGSTASIYAKPTKYTVTHSYGNTRINAVSLLITATFSDTTNVTNNDPIGIYWSGSITFS